MVHIKQKLWNKYLLEFLAVLIPIILVLPVLIWPHYGLFSDADQIIEFPNAFFSNPIEGFKRILKPFDDGRYQPFFYLLTIGIFYLKPNSAFIFYLSQCVMLVSICIVLAWGIRRVTNSNIAGILSVIIFCTSSSFYENFFTLDKIEPRLTFFIALILALFITKLPFKDASFKINKFIFYFCQILLGIFLIFSKESGVFLVASLALAWITLSLAFNFSEMKEFNNYLKGGFFAHLFVFIIFLVLYKALWNSGNDARYVSYQITLNLIVSNFIYYAKTSPELILSLVFSVYWISIAVVKRKIKNETNLQYFCTLCSYCLCIYFCGILIWRWQLDYFLLPAHFFSSLIIVATGWLVLSKFQFQKYRVLYSILGVCLIGLWLSFFSTRIIGGFFIYQQDSLKDELAKYLTSLNWENRRFILTFNHPNSAEVGERIKYFSNLERRDMKKINLFNFWEYGDKTLENIDRFSGSVGLPPKKAQLIEVSKNRDEIVIWNFGSDEGRKLGNIWTYDYLRSGDAVLIPWGENIPNAYHARGIQMYTPLPYFPENISYMEEGGVMRHFGKYGIGWKILRIKKNSD